MTQLFPVLRFLRSSAAKVTTTSAMSSDMIIGDENSGIGVVVNMIDMWCVLNWVVYHT